MTNATANTSLDTRIPQEVIDIFEEYDLSISDVDEQADGDYVIEIASYTNAGGEQSHYLTVSDIEDAKAIAGAFDHMASEWDPNDEAMLWAEHLDATPFDNLIDLCEDLSDYKRDTLEAVAKELRYLTCGCESARRANLLERIPRAVGFVLDRNEVGITGVEKSDDGSVEMTLSAYTPNDIEVFHRLTVADIEDIEEWSFSFSRMADAWEPQDGLDVDADTLMAMPFVELIARFEDLTAYKKQTLKATASDLRLLDSLAFLELIAA